MYRIKSQPHSLCYKNPRFIRYHFQNPQESFIFFFFHHLSFIIRSLRIPEIRQELDTLAESEIKNRDVVLKLYEALRSRDVKSVHQILTPDLEYWFHGPPPHQFLMRVLTGGVSPSSSSFEFVPLSVVSFGSTVIAEGCDAASSISWIHAWTVANGIITQVREYSNTSLTVTRIGNVVAGRRSAEIAPSHCPSVWESQFSGRAGKAVPGLVLAI